MPLPHIQFDGSQSATTDYYPDNGAGAYTATAGDAFNADFEETELRRLICPLTDQDQAIEIYHEDGTLAFELAIEAGAAYFTSDPKWDEGEGPVLRGSWAVQFPVSRSKAAWFVQFARVR